MKTAPIETWGIGHLSYLLALGLISTAAALTYSNLSFVALMDLSIVLLSFLMSLNLDIRIGNEKKIKRPTIK